MAEPKPSTPIERDDAGHALLARLLAREGLHHVGPLVEAIRPALREASGAVAAQAAGELLAAKEREAIAKRTGAAVAKAIAAELQLPTGGDTA